MDGRENGVSPPSVNLLLVAKYVPLDFPNNLQDVHDSYLNIFPKFDGEYNTIVEEHMAKFQDFTNNLLIEYDDVYMRLFVHTLEGEVRKWFRYLPTNSLIYWPTLE